MDKEKEMEFIKFVSRYLQNKMKNVYVPVENEEDETTFKRFSTFRKTITTDINNKFGHMLTDLLKKRVIIVYHGVDIDGLGIRILAEVVEKLGGFKEVLYIPCNKRADEAWDQIVAEKDNYDLCIVADLNFTDEFVETHRDDLFSLNMILLDHHKHAISLNSESWAYVKETKIYEDNISSGTLLFYTLIEPYIAYILDDRNDYDTDMKLDLLKRLEQFTLCTSAHDTWFAHDTKTTDLSLAIFDKVPLYLSLIHKSYKTDYVDKFVENLLFGYKLIDSADLIMCKTTDDIIQGQCTFMWHNCKIYKDENNTIAICYVSQFTSEIGNYILKKQPEIDFVIMINPNVESISLRSRTDEYDVSTLVKPMQGGGHQAAGGFTIPAPGITYKYYNGIDEDLINNLLNGDPELYKNECVTSLKLTSMKTFEYNKTTNKYDIK